MIVKLAFEMSAYVVAVLMHFLIFFFFSDQTRTSSLLDKQMLVKSVI